MYSEFLPLWNKITEKIYYSLKIHNFSYISLKTILSFYDGIYE